MTLKDLKEKYDVQAYEKDSMFGRMYVLYSKTEQGKRIATKFIWYVYKTDTGSFYVKGYKPTTKFDVLEKQIEDKIASLPYDAEYYIPTFRKGYFEEMVIHDYMCDILGFSTGDWRTSRRGFYKLADKNVYGFVTSDIKMSFNGLDCRVGDYETWATGEHLPKEVEVSLHSEKGGWIGVKCKRDVESIKKAIDGLLKPLLVTDSVTFMEKAEKLDSVEDIDIVMNKITNNLEHIKIDYKPHLKAKLLEMAEKL